MIWFYTIVLESMLPCGILMMWNTLVMLYTGWFSSKAVDGYFAFKPDEFQKNFHIEIVWIFTKNSFRYLLGIERPPMPWYMKIHLIVYAIGAIATFWFLLLGGLGYYGLIDLDHWMDLVRANR